MPPVNLHVTPSAQVRSRKLHGGHFAFMRSVVQGVDLRSSWDRYLQIEGSLTDLRVVRSTVGWIRDEFAAAARREDRFGTARLVLVDVNRITEPDRRLPTLEEFADERGMTDYRQAEQLEAYEAEFGKTSARLTRRGRLIAKQLEALRWLEGLIAQPPRARDAIASWLNPTLADHLEAANLTTLAQLIERINGLGHLWYSGIRAMGAGKARRIVDWLNEHHASIGLTLGAHIESRRRQLQRHELAAVVAPATDIRPIEKLILPIELDGSQGLHRLPRAQCRLEAGNDRDAILAWLRSKRGLTLDEKAWQAARRKSRDSDGVGRTEADHEAEQKPDPDWLQALSHTQRAYRKEAERFLLWAVIGRGKALSSMTGEDCAAYRDFLADPQPRRRWCGERSRERWSPLWRPFEGPLSVAAQRHAVGILKNLHGFLVDRNYLTANPWASVESPVGAAPKRGAQRSFDIAQWAFIETQLALRGDHSTDRRLKLVLHLLYATGLRLSEAIAATVADLHRLPPESDGAGDAPVDAWMLRVAGKGHRPRNVSLPAEVVSELADYLLSRGLTLDPENARHAPVHLLGKASDFATRAPGLVGHVPAVVASTGISAHTLYDQIKVFFNDCAAVLAGQGDAIGAERFRSASTHWLRHTHASHAIAGGLPIETAQMRLGHASLATTSAYAAIPADATADTEPRRMEG